MRPGSRLAGVIALVLLTGCADGGVLGGRDEAESADVRTGWIIGPGGEPMQVSFEVVEGDGMLEGDINLGPVERIAKTREALVRRSAPGGPAYGVITTTNRWSSPINYVINGAFTAAEQQTIRTALGNISSQARGVVFHNTTASNYIEFVPHADICDSPVGRQGGRQVVRLAPGCRNNADVQHETLHALGFWHEQSRCDRDSYVQILWDNIIDDKRHNFDKKCSGALDVRGYDEASIMHYHPYSWGKTVNGVRQQTIRSLRGLEHLMGASSGVSSTDVSTLDYMFNPPPPTYISGPSNPPINSWQRWTVVPENGVMWQSIVWHRDRVPVLYNQTTYEACVKQPFELLVFVTDVYGRQTSGYMMVYPNYYGTPSWPSYYC